MHLNEKQSVELLDSKIVTKIVNMKRCKYSLYSRNQEDLSSQGRAILRFIHHPLFKVPFRRCYGKVLQPKKKHFFSTFAGALPSTWIG